MIRKFTEKDIDQVMNLWLLGNLEAHSFIPRNYWIAHFKEVKEAVLHATVIVYESDEIIQGFLGLMENFIAGIFVGKEFRGKGIGKALLDYAKKMEKELALSVYAKNGKAFAFYKREGFTVSKEDSDEETGEKEYMMKWEK